MKYHLFKKLAALGMAASVSLSAISPAFAADDSSEDSVIEAETYDGNSDNETLEEEESPTADEDNSNEDEAPPADEDNSNKLVCNSLSWLCLCVVLVSG